jgi:hypothetical protein
MGSYYTAFRTLPKQNICKTQKMSLVPSLILGRGAARVKYFSKILCEGRVPKRRGYGGPKNLLVVLLFFLFCLRKEYSTNNENKEYKQEQE